MTVKKDLFLRLSVGLGLCCAVGLAGAQTVLPPTGTVKVNITADGNYTLRVDGRSHGQVLGAKQQQVAITLGIQHEIAATSLDCKQSFHRVLNPESGEQIAVKIVGQPISSGAASKCSVEKPRITPKPGGGGDNPPEPPPGPETVNNSPIAMQADQFVRLNILSSPGFVQGARPASAGQAGPTRILVHATQFGATAYDVKVQMVMKGVGGASDKMALLDLGPDGALPNAYSTTTSQIGKEAVVCYTARLSSQPSAMRWTGSYSIQAGSYPGRFAFTPAREPSLSWANNSPCGGLRAAKAPIEVKSPEPTITDTSSDSHEPAPGATAALAQGSHLFVARDWTAARPLLIEACEGNAGEDACNSVGFMYQNHLGVATNYAKAREFYEKACNDDASLSCNNLGTLYRDGLAVPKDEAQALELFGRGCDAGVPEGCDAAGVLTRDAPPPVERNYHQSLNYFKQACEANLGSGCGNEAQMYLGGLGVPKDMTFGFNLMKKGCDLGSRNSCWDTAMMYRRGEGVARDPEKAKEYFTKACEMGDQDSCKYAN